MAPRKRLSPEEIQSRLFSEASLFDVLRSFRSHFRGPFKADWIGLIIFCICAIGLISAGNDSESASRLSEFMLMFVSECIQVAAALLGLSIAGFSVFAASLRVDVLRLLVTTPEEKDQKNYLLFIFSAFIYTMVVVFSVIVSSLLFLLLFSHKSGWLQSLVAGNFSFSAWYNLLSIASAFFIAQQAFVLSVLLSFIWNIHQIMLIVAGTLLLNDESDCETKKE